MVVSDNGAERTSNAILKGQEDRTVDEHDITRGKPMQNGFVDSFNGRIRDECPNQHLFDNLSHARNQWRHGAQTSTTIDPTQASQISRQSNMRTHQRKTKT